MKKQLALLAVTSAISISAAASGFVYTPDQSDGSANIYEYNPTTQYEINTKPGYVTDIELRPGESVQKIATGNSSQFHVDVDTVADTQHIYIKPIISDIQTNIIINTNSRSYRLIVNSSDTPEYIVKWKYPKDDYEDILRHNAEELEKLQKKAVLYQEKLEQKLNTDYVVKQNKNVVTRFVPISVCDDGTKTYIQLSESALKNNMPTVYYYDQWDKNKMQLVNYRLKGNIMEIDKVMDQLRLVYSQKSYLVIAKNKIDKDVPKASEIKVDATITPEVMLQAETNQQEIIPVQTKHISLKEHLEKLQQEKENPTQLDEKLLDQMIEKLEKDLEKVDEKQQQDENAFFERIDSIRNDEVKS